MICFGPCPEAARALSPARAHDAQTRTRPHGPRRKRLRPRDLPPDALSADDALHDRGGRRRKGASDARAGCSLDRARARRGRCRLRRRRVPVAARERRGDRATTEPTRPTSTKNLHPVAPDQPTIALVLGYDHRAGEGGAPSRSDTMMLLRADPRLEDDLDALVPARPRRRRSTARASARPATDKINAAYSFCGAAGSLETVEALTRLPINYLITVNFRGFKKVVEQARRRLGGRRPPLLQRQDGPVRVREDQPAARLPAATGGAALDFVRFRHTDSDLFRIARQQLFVQALKEQFAYLVLGRRHPQPRRRRQRQREDRAPGGGHHLSIGVLAGYAQFARDLPPGHFFQAKIANLTGYSDLTTDPSNIESAVREFVTPNVKDTDEANTVALGGKVKQTAPKPSQTSIVVLNGNGVPGAAADANYRLLQRGYRMLHAAPRPGGERALEALPHEGLLPVLEQARRRPRPARSPGSWPRPMPLPSPRRYGPSAAAGRCSASSSASPTTTR